MSFPFGGHPTFARYLAWATEQGCTVQTGYTVDGHGRTHTLTRIVSPNGKWVVEAGTQQSDYLVPTTIARLDRRLGLTSPFLSLPHPEAEKK